MYKLTFLEMRRLYKGYEIRNREQERQMEEDNPEYRNRKRRTKVRSSDMDKMKKFKEEHGLE